MASSDRQITGLGELAAPGDWQLQPSLVFVPKAVNATFDGSGAGGDFLPALQIVSDSGAVISTVPVGSTVTAGDTAEVTWAPFLENASGGACGGKIDATVTVGSTCGVHSVGQPPGTVLTSDGGSGSHWVAPSAVHSQTAFENVVGSPFNQSIAAGTLAAVTLAHQSQSALLNYTSTTVPTFLSTGVYSITLNVIGEGAVTSNNHYTMRLFITAAAIGNKTLDQEVHSNTLADQTSGTITWTGPLLAGDSLEVEIRNDDTASRVFHVEYFSVCRVLVAF